MKPYEVTTFDNVRLKKLYDLSDPYLRKYIDALKRTLENEQQLTRKCIKKLKEG